MTDLHAPTPPSRLSEEDEFDMQPRYMQLKGAAVGVTLVAFVVLLAYLVGRESNSPRHFEHVQIIAPLPEPSVRLIPSLVVPGPAQQPRPVPEDSTTRPDEVVIFRVNVGGKAFVFLGMEDEEGDLTRIYGGRPDDESLSGSKLLYEDGRVLAYALESHQGTEVTFVVATSSIPWEPLPERIPAEPRTFPEPDNRVLTTGFEPILAWDRVTLKVGKKETLEDE